MVNSGLGLMSYSPCPSTPDLAIDFVTMASRICERFLMAGRARLLRHHAAPGVASELRSA
jgi:hypothetical protein